MNTKDLATLVRKLILFSPFLLILSSCKDDIVATEQNQKDITFNAVIDNERINTRATGTSWEKGDQIGVFAIQSGKELSNLNIYNGVDNVPFTTQMGDGYFVSDKKITYPENGSALDIIAYYPYKDDIINYNYPINIVEQKDFFYSSNLKTISKTNPQQSLTFTRPVLSKVIINITSATENSTLKGLETSVQGAKSKANFSLVTGKFNIDENSTTNFQVPTPGSDFEKQISVLLLPTTKENEITIKFSIDGKNYRFNIPHILESGRKYSYSIRLNKLTAVITTTGYIELPYYTTQTAPNSQLVTHLINGKVQGLQANARNYTLLYDTKNKMPYWVAYPLTADYIGSSGRTDAWDFDPKISTSLQPNLNSGWVTSGFDRGHILPSGDRTATREINKQTFYFTNMAAQNSKMNQGVWSELENKVRSWYGNYDTLYVVTGCILPTPPETISYAKDKSGNSAAVPKYFYKALLGKRGTTYKSIAFKMQNITSEVSYTNRVVSVADIEKETGFIFFPSLPPAVASTVKQNKSLSPDWN